MDNSDFHAENKDVVRIGYLILTHRYPEQLLRLVNRLNCDNVTFLIRVDRKVAPSVNQYLHDQLSGQKNVHFIKRFTCYWAGFGIAQATLQGIKEVIEQKIDIDHLVLLSGQDYPIKSNEFIHQFLCKHKGTSFVNHKPFPQPEWEAENGGWNRVTSWHFIKYKRYVYPCRDIFGSGRMSVLNPLWNLLHAILPKWKRKFPLKLHPFGGAQFWCLSKRHVYFVYDFIQKHPQYVSYFKYVFVPDEILIQTIIGNADFKQEVHNGTLHFLEWERPGAILYTSDKENIFSTYHLFARKFDTTVGANILDIIDNELLYKCQMEKQSNI